MNEILQILAPAVSLMIAALATIAVIFYRVQQSIREIPSLEQQESILEKRRNELEKEQQMLLWQMEAIELAKEDPRLAIVTAYQGMETELQRNLKYPKNISEEIGAQKAKNFLFVNSLKDTIGLENAERVEEMRDLRNRVIHGEVKPEEDSSDEAMKYVQWAILLSRISSSSETDV